MTWLQPAALLGLLALLLPLLIHLLGRDRARLARFPSLRFIASNRLLPMARTRLHDVPLLLVRLALFAAAVFALAQPSMLSRAVGRGESPDGAEVILIDTSASMARRSAGGDRLVDRVRARAAVRAESTTNSIILEANNVRNMVPGALAWLQQQSGRSALTVLSDFQSGTTDSASIARIPAAVGLALERTAAPESLTPVTATVTLADRVVFTRSVPRDSMVTEVRWSTSRRKRSPATFPLLGSTDEHLRLEAAHAAADAVFPIATNGELEPSGNAEATPRDSLTGAAASAIAIMTTGYHAAPRFASDTTVPRTAWMMDAIAKLHGDAALQAAARAVHADPSVPVLPGLVVLRDHEQRALVIATEQHADTATPLHLVVRGDASMLLLATLIAQARDAQGREARASLSTDARYAALAEMEWTSLSDATLARWQRLSRVDNRAARSATAAGKSTANAPTADATSLVLSRALWAMVLLLFVVEAVLRRSMRTPSLL